MTGRLRTSLNLQELRGLSRFFPLVLVALLAWCSGAAKSAAASGQTASVRQQVEQLAAQAEQLESDGKWNEAAAAYRDILRIDPQSIAALNRLGAIEVRQGHFDAGTRYYKQALGLSPDEFVTNLNLGIAYIKMQRFGAAVPALERALILRKRVS
jgi:cytochrome c-type biogenesis protein CcmH/NrfG